LSLTLVSSSPDIATMEDIIPTKSKTTTNIVSNVPTKDANIDLKNCFMIILLSIRIKKRVQY
jgi:hypothetical protein